MTRPDSFLWHDYETWGTRPALDRPSQFAAIRTDGELNPVGEPMNWFCQPADDVLPHPWACLVTGVSPQVAAREGVNEATFARRIHHEMMEPGTCSVGYNSLRFDDEVSRFLFYRNFYDTYEREWRNGNSRFDLIDLVRMYYALRPAGIEWPVRDDGKPSFRLEHLTEANGIAHVGAHDALADVRATIDLARCLQNANRRLLDWGLTLRNKDKALGLLSLSQPEPVLHTSSRIPAERGCTSLVLPLAGVPGRPKSVVVFDLMANPQPLLDLDAEDIADRVFTPSADMPEGVERLPLKAVHANKVPMLAQENVLRGVDLDRISLDPGRCHRHADTLRPYMSEVRKKLEQVFQRDYGAPDTDPDTLLYAGGFFSNSDRQQMVGLRRTEPDQLARENWRFEDPRLPIMLFRYRARNWPDTLDADEREAWNDDRVQRLLAPTHDGHFSLADFREELAGARAEKSADGAAQALLDQVEAWVEGLHLESGAPPN